MNSAIPFVVTALVNAIWQPALIAAIAWTVLKLSRCTNATTRHAVWSLALFASVIVPLLSAMPLVLAPATQQTQKISVPPSNTANVKRETVAPDKAWPAAAVPSAGHITPAGLSVQRPSFHVAPSVAMIASGAWLLVALVILARLLVSFFYLERLKHDALPLSVESRHALTRYDRAQKGDRDVRICVSSEITVPVAIGIFDAMILIPSDLVDELDANDLDRILLHELAHVRRSDDWVNLFERVVQALFFFSPGIYWISRQMDLEREVACDDWVLEQSAENVPYARCLARIVEMTQWPYTAPAAPGVFVTRKSMSIRIERLLARGRDIRVRLALVPSLLALVFIAAVVVAGGFVSPTIAYTLDHSVAATTTWPHHKSGIEIHTMPMKFDLTSIASPAAARTAPLEAAKATRTQTITQTVNANVKVAVKSALSTNTFKNGAESQASSIAELAAGAAASAAPKAQFWSDDQNGASKTVADESYLDDLAAAGYKHLTVDEVIEMKSLGVDADYIRGLQNAGLKNLTPHELCELKSLGVDGPYIAGMRSAGLTTLDPHELSGLKALGVDADYVKGMRAAGLENLDAHDLSGLKALGVDGDYISAMRAAGFRDIDARDLSGLKALGVDADYVSSMRAAGVQNLDAHDLSGLKSLGVDSDYVKTLSDAGYPHLTAHEYESMKSLGVDAAYLRSLQSHGFNHLTVDQVIRMKSLGIPQQ
jgi:beta-lactamase regulating signal transducer with metallopeptidase domain